MKKRILALLCLLGLLSALILPSWASSGSEAVYLLAANDKFCDLPGGVQPVAVNGVIYVPYTLFDKDSSGVDLGVYAGLIYDRGDVLSLYSLTGTLIFTVQMRQCVDGQGNPMNFWAVRRNGIPYVPAAAVCNFFGLQYSFLPTADRGTLIRITNTRAGLSDSLFLSAATGAMTSRYNAILRARNPQPTPTPQPTATPAPTPTPAPPDPERPNKEGVQVYLAVDASRSDTDLSPLFSPEVKALFLFTPDSLPQRASLVRKLVAAGHSIGLIVEGEAETALAQLEEGNELLTHIARLRTHIVSAPAELTGTLTAAGWSCWRPNVTASSSSAILTALDARRTVGRVSLPASPAVISQALSGIREAGYTLRQPLETEL